MDSGATTHLAANTRILDSGLNHNVKHTVIVSNGSKLHVTSIGSSSLPTNSRTLSLDNVLVTPQIVKNLISVCQFTLDNWFTVEFDPFGFSVKDL